MCVCAWFLVHCVSRPMEGAAAPSRPPYGKTRCAGGHAPLSWAVRRGNVAKVRRTVAYLGKGLLPLARLPARTVETLPTQERDVFSSVASQDLHSFFFIFPSCKQP